MIMDSFRIAFNAILPFLIYIVFGAMTVKLGWVTETVLKKFNTLVFKAFFPILMFCNMYNMDTGFKVDWGFIGYVLATILLLIGFLVLVIPRWVSDSGTRGSVIQGIYRSNLVLFALPLTQSIYGESCMVQAAMLIAFAVPVYNVAAVIILEYYGSGGKADIRLLLRGIITNPIIIGIAVGLIFHFAGIQVPAVIYRSLSKFSDMATPLGLFILGGTLKFASLRDDLHLLVPSLAVKMVILPVIFYAAAYFFLPFSNLQRFLVLITHATPVAVSSFAMADNMGCNGRLAGEFVVLSTVISAGSLFLFIFFLSMAGLL